MWASGRRRLDKPAEVSLLKLRHGYIIGIMATSSERPYSVPLFAGIRPSTSSQSIKNFN
jgi:hypothetical protein